MLVSSPIELLDERIGEREAIKVLKDAGFEAFDMSLFRMIKKDNGYYTDEDYIERATALREYIDEIGIVCNQSHAPFPSSFGDERDEWIFGQIVKSMEIASILGAKCIVVHPKQHLNYAEHAAELFDLNVEFYKSLIPYAEKFGIKIATENMWQTNNSSKAPCDSVCSRSWEFCKLIDAVNSPYLVACLDIGHAALMAADIPKFIKDLGSERLQALHVHDIDLLRDNHTLPFLLKINYKPVMEALGEIGYKGDITFEANSIFRNFPAELYVSVARLMKDTGDYLAGVVENSKK
ncbi:MAG: sugar phosphate isomerase/epimerase [Clostridia bacterium]|nr:sugar phosphate isomerase/epimerase [Clostridia bacterium]